jgi:hypothetical protein
MRTYINRPCGRSRTLSKEEIEVNRRNCEVKAIERRILVGWEHFIQHEVDNRRDWIYLCNLDSLEALDDAIANLLDRGIFDGYQIKGYRWEDEQVCGVKISLRPSETNPLFLKNLGKKDEGNRVDSRRKKSSKATSTASSK